jgi:hypothetical protein
VTGAVWQLQSGSPASADVATADSWSALTGDLASSAGTQTVALGADIAAPTGASPVVAVPGGSAVTLDLRGHKLAMGREAGDLKIIVPHGSVLSVVDTTAGSTAASSGPMATGPIPSGGSSGYAGYGGLTHLGEPPTSHSTDGSASSPRMFGPTIPAGATTSAGAEHTTVETSAPATSSKPLPRHAAVGTEHKRASHSSGRDERARGRHRREDGSHHWVRESSRDCDDGDYRWAQDDYYGWWLDPDAP